VTKAKQVAATLKTIHENSDLINILNRQNDSINLCNTIDGYWKYDLYNRKPSPAEYDESGKLIPTDLDLATFMYALWDRGAVINFPTYKSKRPMTIREGQNVVSKDNRHGKVIGLTSNENVFTFGVRIIDQNVVSTDQVGFPRTYLFTDLTGKWYEGWRVVNWLPTASENKFLNENKLWTGNQVVFKNFVTPEKWLSFYGQYYFITKAMIQRLEDEKRFVKEQIKDISSKLPPEEVKKIIPPAVKTTYKVEGEKIKINCFQVEIDIPEFKNEFSNHPNLNKEKEMGSLGFWRDREKTLTSFLSKFRFICRCIEKAAYDMNVIEHFPAWLKDVKWEANYREPGKRTDWNRLVLVQPAPGERGIAIRCRVWEKTETVANEE